MQIFQKMQYLAFMRFFGLFITKTIVNHRTWIWGKPLKNHRCQWSIFKKNIQWWWSGGCKTIEKPSMSMVNLQKKLNGDGQIVAKPLKNHRWQWCPERKKHYHRIVWKKWPSLKSNLHRVKAWLSLRHSVRMRLGFCPAEPRNWKWPNGVVNS